MAVDLTSKRAELGLREKLSLPHESGYNIAVTLHTRKVLTRVVCIEDYTFLIGAAKRIGTYYTVHCRMTLRSFAHGLVLVSLVAASSPTQVPTLAPSLAPSQVQPPGSNTTALAVPTSSPSIMLSRHPSFVPSFAPTTSPSIKPTILPSIAPTANLTQVPTLAPTKQTISVQQGYGLFILFVLAMGAVLFGGAYYAYADIKRMKELVSDAPPGPRSERLPMNDATEDDGIEFGDVSRRGPSLSPMSTRNPLRDSSNRMLPRRQGEGDEF